MPDGRPPWLLFKAASEEVPGDAERAFKEPYEDVWQRLRRGQRADRKLFERIRELSRNTLQSFGRVYERLPNTPKYAQAHEWLRHLSAAPRWPPRRPRRT